VLHLREAARCEHRTHMRRATVHLPRVAPELRRPTPAELAAYTRLGAACLAIVAPAHMHGADEPIPVRRVQAHCVARGAVEKQAGCAEQRDVMEVDDVVAARFKKASKLRAMVQNQAGLLRQKQRKRAGAAAERNSSNRWMIGVTLNRRPAAERA